MFLIDSIGLCPQSAVPLYIYRVGKTYLARNPIYRSKSIKNSNCTRTPLRPVRPVGPTGQTGWSCQIIYRRLDRSDRLDTPVRPVCSGHCQFWSSTVSNSIPEKWLVIGDFNLILQAQDKSNNNLNRRVMGEFKKAVDDLELKELKLKGRRFTWSKDTTQTRIDRAFLYG